MRHILSSMHDRAISVLLLLLLLPMSCATEPETALPERPNILWLVTEDLGPQYLPMYGDSTIATPNLSRLAREGVTYEHVYSVSGVCAPSRFSLATGVYTTSAGAHNMRTGGGLAILRNAGLQRYEVIPPAGVRMMSEVLRENGYYCTNNSKQDYQFKPTITAWDDASRFAHWANRPEGQPFFSIFNFEFTHESGHFGPHSNARFRLRYLPAADPDSVPLQDRISEQAYALGKLADLEVPVPPYLPVTKKAKDDIRRVYANIKLLDAHIGIAIEQLEAAGELENTIVVFYADHGGPLPRQKRLLYDSGIRVPMLIRFPNKWRAGERDDQLISFVDFAPTAMSLAGVQPPANIQGRAFAGKYASGNAREFVHAAADRLDDKRDMIRAVRNKRFKYLRNFKPEQPYYLALEYRERLASMQELLRLRDAGKLTPEQAQWFRASKPPEELFDCENDPHELNNLAADPKYADVLASLRAECERWMEEMQDKGNIPELQLANQFAPGWQQPQTAPVSGSKQGEHVKLTCQTDGVAIGYQLVDGEENARDAWMIYSAPVKVPPGKTLIARADRIGYEPSELLHWPAK